MKKRLLNVAGLLALSIGSLCANDNTRVIVEGTDNTKLEFVLTTPMTFCMGNDSIWINSVNPQTNVETELSRLAVASVRQIYYAGRNTNIEPTTSEKQPSITTEGEYIRIEIPGKFSSSTMRIISADGKVCPTNLTMTDDNTATLYIGTLPKGIYIIQINSTSFKFVKQ